jgi:hypothetical protein
MVVSRPARALVSSDFWPDRTPLLGGDGVLPRLAPSGSRGFYGRAVRLGLAVALVWVAIGLAASLQLAVVAGFVAYCIVTGIRRLESAPPAIEG